MGHFKSKSLSCEFMSLLTLGNVYDWMMSVISPEMFMAEWCMLSPLTCFAFGKFEYFYLIQTRED
jgi:hypothetical protein